MGFGAAYGFFILVADLSLLDLVRYGSRVGIVYLLRLSSVVWLIFKTLCKVEYFFKILSHLALCGKLNSPLLFSFSFGHHEAPCGVLLLCYCPTDSFRTGRARNS